MPELPEVETVCRTLRQCLVGHKIVEVEVAPDEIVLSGTPPNAVREALLAATVTGIGRQGKYWWIETDRRPWAFGHLGMAGWVRRLPKEGEVIESETRLKEHGKLPFEDATGRPKFLKLLLKASNGEQVAFTDGRRLARLWLSESPEVDLRLAKLSPDVRDNPWNPKALHQILSKRTAPIKSLLLDQSLFAGVGNWIADEMLYQARISPKREASSLSFAEIKRLLSALKEILESAIQVSADSDRFPPHWLFHHRWGGARGAELIDGHAIVRESVGSRTTAWVPKLQK